MKKSLKRVASVFLSACMLIGMAACKEKTETVTVHLDAGNGQSVPSMTREVGEMYGKLPTPTWENQEFLGWYSEEIGGTPVSDNMTVTENHTLYARWSISPVNVLMENDLSKPYEAPLVQYPLKTESKRIMAAYRNTYVIDQEGKLHGWGVNEEGQLGNGTMEDSATPVQIMPEKRFTYVDSRSSNTYAIDTEGNLWGLGGRYTVLGDGTKEVRTTPVQIMSGTKFYKVAASGVHSYAIDINGNLWGWGREIFGPLDKTEHLFPVQIQKGVRFFDVDTYGGHTVALDEYGRLWTWGTNINSDGELGTGPMVDFLIQVQTHCYERPILIESSIRFTQVQAGYDCCSAALDVNGNLWTWGKNDRGSLGNGVDDTESVFSPTQITSGNKFSSLYRDLGSFAALSKTGDVWYWGQPGPSLEAIGKNYPEDVYFSPTLFMQGYNFIDLSFGTYHVVALDSNGDIWVWGNNSHIALGFGQPTKENISPTKYTFDFLK